MELLGEKRSMKAMYKAFGILPPPQNPFIPLSRDPLMGPASPWMLLKGHLSSDMNYSGDTFKFPKTGKLIKANLMDKLIELIAYKEKCYAELMNMKVEGYTPTKDPDDYDYGGFGPDKFENMPKMYSYEQQEEYRKSMESEIISHSSMDDDSEMPVKVYEGNSMYDYNDKCRMYYRICCDILCCQLLIKELNDTKSYSLSLEQLKMLGF